MNVLLQLPEWEKRNHGAIVLVKLITTMSGSKIMHLNPQNKAAQILDLTGSKQQIFFPFNKVPNSIYVTNNT
jgi:hypothetical protein